MVSPSFGSQVVTVKSHTYIGDIPEDLVEDKPGNRDPWFSKWSHCRKVGGLHGFNRYLLLHRDPYDSIFSTYKLLQAETHNGKIMHSDFNAAKFVKSIRNLSGNTADVVASASPIPPLSDSISTRGDISAGVSRRSSLALIQLVFLDVFSYSPIRQADGTIPVITGELTCW